MTKPKVAIIRGKFLNQYEMQSYEPLSSHYDMTAFGSLTSFHSAFSFPVVKSVSPVDLPPFPHKMPILNRMCTDAHILFGLEKRLKGFDIAHSAETYFYYTKQVCRAKEKGYVGKVIVSVIENIPHANELIRGRSEIKSYVRSMADHFIAISQKAKNALIVEGVPQKKIDIIGYGVDTTRFAPSEDHWDYLGRKKMQTMKILFVGRLVKEKGIEDVLAAFDILKKKEANTTTKMRLIIVGSGDKKNIAREYQKKYPQDIELMEVEYKNMHEIYKIADIIVAPSRTTATWIEQFNIALMEAQSLGVPIITTDTGSIEENVKDAGIYVEQRKPEEIAQAIEWLRDHPQGRLSYGLKGRERAEQIHNQFIIAKKISNVYQKVLMGR